MKKISTFTYILLLATGILSSCSDDDTPSLMSVSELTDKTITASQLELTWNGKNYTTPYTDIPLQATFQTTGSDVSRLKLTLKNVYAVDIETEVDAIPGENEITFSGSTSSGPYNLEVKGTFTKQRSDSKEQDKEVMQLECKYEINDNWIELEHPYTFRFDNHCMAFMSTEYGNVEWNGTTYTKTEFAESILSDICARIARKTAAMQLVFHANASLDILVQETDEADFTPFTSIRYSLGKDSQRLKYIYLELTEEQAEYFDTHCVGQPGAYIPTLDLFDGVRPILPLIYFLEKGSSLSLNIAQPYRASALSRYAQTVGAEGLSEDEHDQLIWFANNMTGKTNTDQMGWLFLMISEIAE